LAILVLNVNIQIKQSILSTPYLSEPGISFLQFLFQALHLGDALFQFAQGHLPDLHPCGHLGGEALGPFPGSTSGILYA
jgi:hypothetical protein